MKILNLGCGFLKMEDAINVDICKEVDPDIIYDLNRYPWSFCYGHYDKVFALDIFEHVNNRWKFMEAIWKVLKLGGEVELRTTCWQTENSFTDPSHQGFYTLKTFDYWDSSTEIGKKYGYQTGKAKFKILKRESSGQELVFILKKLEV
jgi:cyclopropane fatty-acyl-phospholipid synthase-like methyltransferase